MGSVVSKLVHDLMSIDGVVNVWLHPYEITVLMAHAFEWNPRIDRLIENTVAQLESGKNSSGNVVLIETHPNPRRRSFHTNREVSQTYLKMFDRPLLGYESDLRMVGTLGEKIIRDIFRIPGVTKINIQPYEICVEIGKAFSWDDIEPKVSLAILFGFII